MVGIVVVVLAAGGVAFLLTRSSSNTGKVVVATTVVTPTTHSKSTSTTTRHRQNSTTTTNPSSKEQAQTAEVALIVSQSASARANVGNAITTIGSCGDIQGAVTTLQNDATTRSNLAAEAGSLELGAVPNGSAISTNLQQAMFYSAASDRNYAAWGTALLASGSCQGTAPQDSNWTAAQQSDSQATAAKTAFVAVWNPVAQQLGLATQQPNQF